LQRLLAKEQMKSKPLLRNRGFRIFKDELKKHIRPLIMTSIIIKGKNIELTLLPFMNTTYILELTMILSFALATLLWTIRKKKEEKGFPTAK
jgi:hypothetical protein